MKSHCLYFVLGIVSCLSIHFPHVHSLSGDTQQADESTKKISELEDRVKRLEAIVYATAKLSTEEAQRRLSNAKQAFEHSRKLRKKGFITQAQLQADNFAYKQAELELKLAQGTTDDAKTGAQLRLMNAEQKLLRAQQELEYTKKLAAKGFATEYQVQRQEMQIRAIELQVATAKRQAETTKAPSD